MCSVKTINNVLGKRTSGFRIKKMLPFICRALVHFGICSLLNFKYVHLDFFIQNLSIFIIWKFFLMKIFMQKKSENISIYLYLQFFAVWLLLKGLYKILQQVFWIILFYFLPFLSLHSILATLIFFRFSVLCFSVFRGLPLIFVMFLLATPFRVSFFLHTTTCSNHLLNCCFPILSRIHLVFTCCPSL